MDNSVSLLNQDVSTEVVVPISEAWEVLTLSEQYWIEFRACHGYHFDEDGKIARMKVGECAVYLGVTDTTLRNWEKRIKQFWELVAWRRKALFGGKIVSAAWGATAAKASAGEDAAVERILTNFDPNYKSPKQNHELDIGDNLVEIFNLMRQEAQVIDGEYTEVDSGTGTVDEQERPTIVPAQP